MANKTKRVVLDRPHTHAGVRYAAGDTADLRPQTAQWLVDRGDAHWPEPTQSEVSDNE